MSNALHSYVLSPSIDTGCVGNRPAPPACRTSCRMCGAVALPWPIPLPVTLQHVCWWERHHKVTPIHPGVAPPMLHPHEWGTGCSQHLSHRRELCLFQAEAVMLVGQLLAVPSLVCCSSSFPPRGLSLHCCKLLCFFYACFQGEFSLFQKFL